MLFMEKKVLSIVDYVSGPGYKCVGPSMTVPNEAFSLKDLVYRSQVMAMLPDIAKKLEYGEDETFDDAFPNDLDLADYIENKSYIVKLYNKLKEVKEADKASKKADKASNSSETIVEPLENQSV